MQEDCGLEDNLAYIVRLFQTSKQTENSSNNKATNSQQVYGKKCSTSQITRETQMETALRSPLAPQNECYPKDRK